MFYVCQFYTLLFNIYKPVGVLSLHELFYISTVIILNQSVRYYIIM
jgi:hypothetical protein